MTGLYLGWLQESVIAGAHARYVAEFETKMARHLSEKRDVIHLVVTAAVEVASESASELAGDTFRSETTQSARRDLEALVRDEIVRCFLSQIQRDQISLISLRHRERLVQLAETGVIESVSVGVVGDQLLYRPDTLGRRRKSAEYVAVETQSRLFELVNTLSYALMLARGDTVCALSDALGNTETIRLENFLKVQEVRMHPRSTLLVHGILDS